MPTIIKDMYKSKSSLYIYKTYITLLIMTLKCYSICKCTCLRELFPFFFFWRWRYRIKIDEKQNLHQQGGVDHDTLILSHKPIKALMCLMDTLKKIQNGLYSTFINCGIDSSYVLMIPILAWRYFVINSH